MQWCVVWCVLANVALASGFGSGTRHSFGNLTYWTVTGDCSVRGRFQSVVCLNESYMKFSAEDACALLCWRSSSCFQANVAAPGAPRSECAEFSQCTKTSNVSGAAVDAAHGECIYQLGWDGGRRLLPGVRAE